jgi:Fur family transcriptional regulator, zinc uptake regulator
VSRHNADRFTRNQTLVLGALSRAAAPLSAYELLDKLRGSGLKAPLQVYRALEKLVAAGMVHRLESLNAFVACSHPDGDLHERVAFAICDDCGAVSEFADDELNKSVEKLARHDDFHVRKLTIELRGQCARCGS